MRVVDCVTSEIKASGLSEDEAWEMYERLVRRRNGYCIAPEVDEVAPVKTPTRVETTSVKSGKLF